MGASRAGQLGRSAPGTRPAAAADRAVRLVRPLTALGGLGVLELLAVRTSWRSWQVLAGPAPASLPEAVVALVLAVCAVLGGWLLLSTAVAVAAHLPGGIGATSRRWAAAWAPVVTRRVAAVLVGAALGSGAVPPAGAIGDSLPPASGPGFALTRPISPDPASRPLDAAGPGWTPSRPTHQAPDATRLVAGAGARPAGEVVVHRGDSLWSIVRRTLGPGASDAEVAAVWPRWHAANRDVVGPDPDRLLPGQVLRPPEPAEQPAQPDGVSR